jgi:hypothetical protein
MRRRVLVLVLALTALALIGSTVPATVSADHSWGPYHWGRTSNPFTVKLGDNVSGPWDAMLVKASADWSVSAVLDTTVVAGGTRPKSCRVTAGQVEVCSSRYGNTGWLGLAQIWITSGNHIVQGIVKNNDYYFGNSTYQYNNTAEMQHVICQEIGHTFGLDHQSENGQSLNTCMDYYHNTTASDTQSTEPNAGDYDELLCIYDVGSNSRTLTSGGHSCIGTGHLDSSSTVASAPTSTGAGMSAAHAAAASGWGRVVASSDHGRSQTFVLDLGGGRAIVTFVIWAR